LNGRPTRVRPDHFARLRRGSANQIPQYGGRGVSSRAEGGQSHLGPHDPARRRISPFGQVGYVRLPRGIPTPTGGVSRIPRSAAYAIFAAFERVGECRRSSESTVKIVHPSSPARRSPARSHGTRLQYCLHCIGKTRPRLLRATQSLNSRSRTRRLHNGIETGRRFYRPPVSSRVVRREHREH
jgi:hypothetical protein